MIQKRFDEMGETEFARLVDDYITRTATNYGEIPAEFFLDLLIERMAAKMDETVGLSSVLDTNFTDNKGS